MMRLERTGCRTAGNGMQHRRFDFQEMTVVEILADSLYNFGPFDECVLDFRIDNQVQIALTVPRFFIGQAMEFFRQRPQGFGKECPFFDTDRRFPCMSRKDRAFYTDNVPDVQQFEQII